MDLLDKIAASPELMRDFQRERLSGEVTDLICRLMDDRGMSRAELAARLGKSRAYVTKLLRGDANMTVKTISDVFHTLGRSLRVVDRPLSVWTPRLMVIEADPSVGRVASRHEVYSHLSGRARYRLAPSFPMSDDPQAA